MKNTVSLLFSFFLIPFCFAALISMSENSLAEDEIIVTVSDDTDITINYAEDNKTILDFMKKINVEFPVLMDQDGNFAKKWNVITYPSTFVIDKNGKIIYGVNAAIEWDDPEFIEKIKSLL